MIHSTSERPRSSTSFAFAVYYNLTIKFQSKKTGQHSPPVSHGPPPVKPDNDDRIQIPSMSALSLVTSGRLFEDLTSYMPLRPWRLTVGITQHWENTSPVLTKLSNFSRRKCEPTSASSPTPEFPALSPSYSHHLRWMANDSGNRWSGVQRRRFKASMKCNIPTDT